MTSSPARRQPAASSSSHSPPRGRMAMASLPRQGPGIQKRSGFILLHYLSRKPMDVLHALGNQADSMMAIQNRFIWSNLERISLTRGEGRFQFAGREAAKRFKFRSI